MAINQDSARRLLTPEEVAGVLNVSRGWVYRNQDRLPVLRLGCGPKAPIRIDSAHLAVWLKASGRGQLEKAVIPR